MRLRGVTLIEAVLFISISLGLIVGGLVFFQQASLSERVSKQTRVLSAIVSESRAMLTNKGNFDALPQLTNNNLMAAIFQGVAIDRILVAAGAVPQDIVVPPGSLQTEWGTDLYVHAGTRPSRQAEVLVALMSVPERACSRLITVSDDGVSLFSDGVNQVLVQRYSGGVLDQPPPMNPPISPSAAGSYCTAGSDGIVDILFVLRI